MFTLAHIAFPIINNAPISASGEKIKAAGSLKYNFLIGKDKLD